MRGYFGIGIENPKSKENVGGLWRSAHAFGAAFIFTIGFRYRRQYTDTTKAWTQIPFYAYADFADFQRYLPLDCPILGVETDGNSIANLVHLDRAIYLLGAEDYGLSEAARRACSYLIRIPSAYCLNVATAGSIVMYDRIIKSSNRISAPQRNSPIPSVTSAACLGARGNCVGVRQFAEPKGP